MATQAQKDNIDAAITATCAEIERMAEKTGADFQIGNRRVDKVAYMAHLMERVEKLRTLRRSMDEPFIGRSYGRQAR